MAKVPCTDGRRNNRPPVSGQFKPGVSPNPNGRKGGGRNKKTVVQDAFNTKVTVTHNGKTARISRYEAGLQQLAVKFAQGDDKALASGLKILASFGLLDQEHAASMAQLTERDEPVISDILTRIRATNPPDGSHEETPAALHRTSDNEASS